MWVEWRGHSCPRMPAANQLPLINGEVDRENIRHDKFGVTFRNPRTSSWSDFAGKSARATRAPHLSVAVAVLALNRKNIRLVFFERVDVHHPVEDYGMEGSARGVAGFLRGDRSP